MALLDEQLVEEWLNRQNFFTMRGIKCGVDEIDILAIRPLSEGLECWHVEVQISYRPVGYIGGDTSARKRTEDELRAGVEQWVENKFTSARKIKRRNELLQGATWRNFLVHAVLKDEAELPLMQALGVELIPYRQILNDLCNDSKAKSSSVASGIIEMLNLLDPERFRGTATLLIGDEQPGEDLSLHLGATGWLSYSPPMFHSPLDVPASYLAFELTKHTQRAVRGWFLRCARLSSVRFQRLRHFCGACALGRFGGNCGL